LEDYSKPQTVQKVNYREIMEMPLFHQWCIGMFVWSKIILWLVVRQTGVCNFIKEYFIPGKSSDFEGVKLDPRDFQNGVLLMSGDQIGDNTCLNGEFVKSVKPAVFSRNLVMLLDMVVGNWSALVLMATFLHYRKINLGLRSTVRMIFWRKGSGSLSNWILCVLACASFGGFIYSLDL